MLIVLEKGEKKDRVETSADMTGGREGGIYGVGKGFDGKQQSK